MKNEQPKFTAKEIELIENFCAYGKTQRHFGQLQAKAYIGTGEVWGTLRFLNEVKKEKGVKYVGSLQAINEGEDTFWYLNAINGERYRIAEPADGIDEIFDIEFKRKDV